MPTESQQPPEKDYQVNFFRPRPGYMRRKVLYIWVLLFSWAFFTFGFQALLSLTGGPTGEGRLTDLTLFGFPLHYFFTGHFLIVWFILLCVLFNLFIDRLGRRYRKRR